VRIIIHAEFHFLLKSSKQNKKTRRDMETEGEFEEQEVK